MKKNIQLNKILVFGLLFLLSSCFDITEKIKHNSDQSGEYSLVIDFSPSWIKVKAAVLLGNVDGVNIPSEEKIRLKLSKFKEDAQQIKGISNVITAADFDNYIFKINFSYQSIEALNAVMNKINKNEKTAAIAYFKETNGNFERLVSYPIPKKISQKEDRKNDLLSANLITIYAFEKEIASYKNPNSKISKNKKILFLKQNVWSFLKNESILNNTITLKS